MRAPSIERLDRSDVVTVGFERRFDRVKIRLSDGVCNVFPMRTRSFWVLDEADERLVDRLAAGLGRLPARILAYLLLRAERTDEPTTTVHLQVGTNCNRTSISDGTARLEALDLVDRSAVRADDSAPGRPQTAWSPTAGVEATVRRAYRRHADELLELAADCHGVGSPTDGRDASVSSPLTVALNWHPNALHAPIYAAREADWYERFDVDVELAHCDGSRRALARVGSGAADVGLAGAATVARARAAGEPVVPVAVCYQRAMTVLYTSREAFGDPLRSVSQLEGRRIGTAPSSETRLLGRLFLSQTTGGDVRIVDTNGEERDALRRGEADVVTGSISDPRELERQGATVDVLRLTDHFPIYGPTFVVRESTLGDRPPALEGFLAGTTAGWATARLDAGPAAERIAALDGVDESASRLAETFARAASDFGDSDAVRDRGWGWQREPMWDRLRTALRQADLLEPA